MNSENFKNQNKVRNVEDTEAHKIFLQFDYKDNRGPRDAWEKEWLADCTARPEKELFR